MCRGGDAAGRYHYCSNTLLLSVRLLTSSRLLLSVPGGPIYKISYDLSQDYRRPKFILDPLTIVTYSVLRVLLATL